MRIFITTAAIFFIAFSAGAVNHHNLIQVPITSKTTMVDVQSLGMDIVRYDRAEDFLELVATPADEDELLANGIGFSRIIEDLESYYASRLDPSEPMGGYHTFSEAVTEINLLHTNFPNIVGTPYSIGQSIQGNELWVVKISDNPEIDENEPEVFYNGLIHAREPMALENLLYFMHYLTDNYPSDPEVAYLVENREMFFLPVFNPDGYLLNELIQPGGGGMWRKNLRDNNNSGFFEPDFDGVDLNRNFGYMWGYDNIGSSPDPGDETYRGTAPFSEPETQVVRDFVNSREFTLCLNYHSYGNLYIHAWGYDYLYTEDHDLFSELGWKMSAYNDYLVGPGWMNLYTTNGGANDWMYGDTLHSVIYSYVVEIATWQQGGFWPPEQLILPLSQAQLEPNLLIAGYADDPRRALRPQAPIVTPLDTVTGPFNLTWNPNTDPSNPPVSYDVIELRGRSVIVNNLETNPDSEWVMDGFLWSASRSYSGDRSFWSNAQNNSVTIAAAAETYSVDSGDTLTFWTYFNIEDGWDYGYVQVSRDGGYAFTSLEGNITTNTNPHHANLGNGITGVSNGWIRAEFDISAYAGENIILRFIYVTDDYTLNEGWFIDDIHPWVSYGGTALLAQSHPDTFLNVDPGCNPETIYYRARAIDGEEEVSFWSAPEDAVVDPLGVSAGKKELPRKFNITGIHPNPFNPTTVVEFHTAAQSPASLELFDIAGRTVRSIRLGVLNSGEHRLELDCSDLNSGVYLLRLQSGVEVSSRKVVLLK